MKKISILTPSRGRPGNALNMVQSVIVKAKDRDNLKLWFWLDKDDLRLDEYMQNLVHGPYAEWIHIMEEERQPLGKCWNAMAKNEAQQGDILMMGNDDWVMTTGEWDRMVRDEVKRFKDNVYVLYPHDSNDGKCSFPIVSKQWVKTLGYLYPEIFEFLAHDTYTERVGEKLGRLHKIDITLDHKHFAFGKSKYDETYRFWRDKGSTRRDVELLDNSQELITSDVKKLKKLMK